MVPIVTTLKADPLKFLKAFPIKIATVGASGVIDYVSYGQKTDPVPGAGYQTSLMFKNGFASFSDPSKVETCKSHIVKAASGAPQFYTLTADSDFMLTSQLSGCCMVLDRSVNPPQIAHCWPDQSQGETGITLQTALEGNANYKLYGAKNYIVPYSYVIGVRNGTWRFFAQERPRDIQITRAVEILI